MSEPQTTFVMAMPIGHWTPVLPMALRSIAAQDGVTVQLAVMDASGDERVAAVLDERVDLISYRRNGPDAGQSAAIQEGWDALSGEVHGWLNADDWLYPGALRAVAEAFRAEPGAGVYTAQSMFFRVTGEAITFTGLHPEVRCPDESLARTNTLSQPSTFVTASALEAVSGLDTGLHYTMDWDLWLRLQSAEVPFVFDPEPRSGVLMQTGTKTSQFSAARRREIEALVRERAGSVAALKSMAAFWMTHRAEAEARPGPFSALRRSLQAGPSTGPPSTETWPQVHYRSGPMRHVTIDADAPVYLRLPDMERAHRVAPNERLEINLAPGKVLPLVLEGVSGTRFRGVTLRP